jgi:PAS domain S-box-containing protein
MATLATVKGLRADGSQFPAEVAISQFGAAGGKFYTAVVRDTSERRRAEEALRENEQRFLLAVETAQLGTYERDLLTNKIRVNEVCREILGVGEEALPPDIAQRSVHPLDKERVLAAVARAFDPEAQEVCAAEFRILRPDGKVRWVAGRGRVVFDDTVTPPRRQKFLGVLLDITERKLAEEEVLRAKQELIRTNAELEQRVRERTVKLQEMLDELDHMSYSMIHDMRAPLRAIHCFGGILEEDLQIRGEALELVSNMRKAAHRMDQLLTGALDYNKAVRSEMPLAPVNVPHLLGDILASHPEFKRPHAEVSLEGEFPWVIGNEAGLAQCFAELLRNGVKFVEPGKVPRVKVSAKRVASPENTKVHKPNFSPGTGLTETSQEVVHDWVRLYFEDNGIGIPESGKVRIFEMFQRMHGPEYSGTGIGLALVRKVIEHMGGRVGVESEEGKGSRFWLEIPLSPATHASQREAA